MSEAFSLHIIDFSIIFLLTGIKIRTGHGPENITRLRRFVVGLIKSKGAVCVAQKIRELVQNIRLVFDYLKMTKNSYAASCS